MGGGRRERDGLGLWVRMKAGGGCEQSGDVLDRCLFQVANSVKNEAPNRVNSQCYESGKPCFRSTSGEIEVEWFGGDGRTPIRLPWMV